MKTHMTFFCRAIAASLSLLAAASASAAWPDDHPIELVVGFAPGGGTGIMARNLAPVLEKHLGGSARIVVVSKPGAGGGLAAAYVQNAKPDGYTLTFINAPGYVFLPMYQQTSYQPEKIRLIARIVDDPTMLVTNPDKGLPATLAGFMAATRKTPGGFDIGHAGEGTTGHLGMAELAAAADFPFVSIPFKGASEARLALLGGHVDYAMISTGEAMTLLQDGSKMVGVAQWSGRRIIKNIPTASEAGYDVRMSSERGIGAPLGLPDEIAERLEKAIEASLKDPEFLTRSPADAPVLAFLPGAQWQKELTALRERLRPLVKQLNAAK